jgi:formyl-CoA transferase
MEHPVAGHLRDARPAPRFGATPVAPGAAAPAIGQHTRAILGEFGFGERVDAWLASGLVTETTV